MSSFFLRFYFVLQVCFSVAAKVKFFFSTPYSSKNCLPLYKFFSHFGHGNENFKRKNIVTEIATIIIGLVILFVIFKWFFSKWNSRGIWTVRLKYRPIFINFFSIPTKWFTILTLKTLFLNNDPCAEVVSFKINLFYLDCLHTQWQPNAWNIKHKNLTLKSVEVYLPQSTWGGNLGINGKKFRFYFDGLK